MTRSSLRRLGAVLSGMVLATALDAAAATVLFDFEAPDAAAAWSARGAFAVARDGTLATEGSGALRAAVPAFAAGADQWPAFEGRSAAPADWSGYDRLVLDLNNPGGRTIPLWLFVADVDMKKFQDGLKYPFVLPVRGARRYVIPLAGLPAGVNRARMGRLHFFTERPREAFVLGLDRVMLLAPGEDAGTVPPAVAEKDRVPPPLLFDFETPESAAAWHNNHPGSGTLERRRAHAADGEWSLRFSFPPWKDPLPAWPSIEARLPTLQDWSGFDRLVFDVVNPGDFPAFLGLMISDDLVPFRQGLNQTQTLPAGARRRVVVPFDKFPAKVDRSRIGLIHLFGDHPAKGLELYFDAFRLLRPGEEAPPPTAALREWERDRFRDRLPPLPPEPDPGLRATTAEWNACAAERRALHDAADAVVADPGAQLPRREAEHLAGRIRRLASVAAWEGAAASDGTFLAGVASSMEKIPPRAFPFEVGVGPIETTTARRETESFQVVVMPRGADLADVAVSVGPLASADGTAWPAGAITVSPVGFVETRKPPIYGTELLGWWPDPLLPWVGSVPVAAGDVQTFWVRLACPADQPPGRYAGRVTVRAGDVARDLPLAVTVRNFALPPGSPLALAVSSSEELLREGVGERWPEVKPAYVDLLASYLIGWDHLYGGADFATLERLEALGRLRRFNLGYLRAPPEGDGYAAFRDALLARLRPRYEEAVRRGWVDRAYIYGYDEMDPARFPVAGRLARELKAAFPGVKLMTTAHDSLLGSDESPLWAFDAFVPRAESYRPERAAAARANGKEVWWYVCMAPPPPYANFFIDRPALEPRLLMGALAAKYRPDGFLYYAVGYWNGHGPITRWPFTDWPAETFGHVWHGDGQWLVQGPGHRPAPTIRLENFRDGLEDLAYVRLLELAAASAQAAGTAAASAWAERALAAACPPEAVAATMTEYTRRPADVAAWRTAMAECLEAAPVPLPLAWPAP